MKSPRLLLLVIAFAFPHLTFGLSAQDVARARKILTAVVELSSQYQALAVTVPAPSPLTDNSGKYFLPYNSKGELTAWAGKALSAQVGAAVGAKAGEKAGSLLSSQIPLGGLFAGAAKKKGKELGALAAIGGPEFVKASSDLSFANLEDYAVYLHVTHGDASDYAQALATAMSIYPDLEKGYQPALKKAYAAASKAQKTAAK